MERNLWKASPLVKQWARAFIAVLIVPIVLNFITYIILRNDLRKDLENKNTLLSKSVQEQVDLGFSWYPRIGAELGIDIQIIKISMAEDVAVLTPETERYFKEVLRRYYVPLYTAAGFGFYFPGMDMVGTSAGFEADLQYFQNTFGGMDITYDEWTQWMAQPDRQIKILKGKKSVSGVQEKYAMFKYDLVPYQSSVVIVVRDSQFLMQIEKAMGGKSGVNYEIYSKDGELVATSLDSDTASAGVLGNITQDQGAFSYRLGGKPVIVNYVTSESTGWRYVFYTDKSKYYTASTTLRNMAILLFIAVAIGAALIPYLVRRQYSPMKQILSRVPSKYSDKKDEYSQIETLVLEAVQQIEQTKTVRERSNRQLRDNFWSKLLGGAFSNVANSNIQKYLKPEFSALPNAVVLLPMQNYVELFQEEDIPSYERYTLMLTVLENIGSELLLERGLTSYFLESGGNCVILVQMDSAEEMLALSDTLESYLKKLEEYFGLHLSAAVSKWHEGVYELTNAYSEALSCLDYINYVEKTDVLLYEDIEKERSGHFLFSAEEISKLCSLMQFGDGKQSCAYMDDLMYRFTHSADFEPGLLQYYIRDVVNTITKNFQEYLPQGDDAVNDLYMMTLHKRIDAASIQRGLHTLIESICGQIKSETETSASVSATEVLAQNIEAYVKEHYMEADFSAGLVAQEFHINTSYVSRVFKNFHKEGFVAYVSRMRIDKAKELLTQTDMKIDDISHEIGFLNTSSFIRLFKKEVGTTPGNYRKTKS